MGNTQINETRELAKAMRAAGKTYAEIGKALGVTKQRAEQIVKYKPGSGLHVHAIMAIPYKGLREWMLENEVCVKELERRCGCFVQRAVKGEGCQKYTIDAIMRVTGLDYETCFEVG